MRDRRNGNSHSKSDCWRSCITPSDKSDAAPRREFRVRTHSRSTRAFTPILTTTYFAYEMNVSQGPPATLQTPGFAHYSVAWSPFHSTRVALASAANFGLVGNGRLHLVSLLPGPGGASGIKIDK